MNHTKRFVQVLLLSLLLVLPSAAQKSPEGAIYDKIKMRLANDPDVKGGNLDVEVKNGVVTLQGKVEKPLAKAKAEKLVKKIKGVTQVINKITVEP